MFKVHSALGRMNGYLVLGLFGRWFEVGYVRGCHGVCKDGYVMTFYFRYHPSYKYMSS